MRFSLKPVVLTLLYFFANTAAAEQVRAQVAPTQDDPAYLESDLLQGQTSSLMEASGKAVLTKTDQTIRADRLLYNQETNDAEGFGSVVLEQKGNTISGPHMKLNMGTHAGFMEQPLFFLKDTGGHGAGDMAHIQDQQHYTLDNATYTTCRATDPDWQVKMSSLVIDRDQQVANAYHARIDFKKVPILYTPWMDFPLNHQRKSGFLSPTFGGTNTSGSELLLPYYWNIAPNYDATFTPRILTKRGLQLNNEFRYLWPDIFGEVHVDVLPGDALTKTDRTRVELKHYETFGGGFAGSVDYNHVSDDAYYRDLAGTVGATTQVNLLQNVELNYNAGWWNSTVRVQQFQTLQDPLAPIAVPYARLPQLTLGGTRSVDGVNFTFNGEYVSFSHPTQINGQRLVFAPSASYPLIKTPGFYLTPKFTLNSTQYVMGNNNATGLPDTSRTLPLFSLDSGAVFERAISLYGNDYMNTLEPRAYYVYVPYKSQDKLPVFDTVQAPFNFAQMFTENRFVGNDRIGDANQVTLAVISRFLGEKDGIEHLKLSLGERFSFATPQVNLVAPTTSTNKSDILMAGSGAINRNWSFDSELQYSPAIGSVQHYNISTSYRPEAGKVLNLGYRFIADTIGALIPGVVSSTGSTLVNGVVYPTIYGVPYTTLGGNNYAVASPALRQFNISGQWPLSRFWHMVGQWNYSFLDNRLLNGVAGIEYEKDCWTLRIVAHSYTNGLVLTSAGVVPHNNTGVLVQLELNDLIKVGSDPLQLLKKSIPGYTKSRIIPENSQITP
jgi:LPS-assembly protein